MMGFMISVLKIFGIVFLRFRPVPRIWNVWLVGVNLLCLYFIWHIEAQVVLATTLVSVVAQASIQQRIGFTRVLGIAHITWVPMFAWLATRIDSIAAHPDLQAWLLVLTVTNVISMIVDATDVFRFARGERAPHYSWG